eukprot:JP436882.1.p5 GENE.JP436882.1~~JP436882.1.p5  ORF type:complete len:57 (+),score=1.86 JP436882.1:405-575(+)
MTQGKTRPLLEKCPLCMCFLSSKHSLQLYQFYQYFLYFPMDVLFSRLESACVFVFQ